MNATDAATAVAADPETTLLSMFWSAHIVVKIVMLGLLAASFWCWAIIVNKTLLFARRAMDELRAGVLVRRVARGALQTLSSRPTVATARCSSPPCASGSALSRTRRASFMGLQARIEKVLDVSIAREVERLEANLLVLATVASLAPFVGLFGTVWGIMTSFRSIAASKNTSLAVVAPGIAEALLATAIGLFAAIPALIAYNKLSGRRGRAQARMESFADEFSSILSRQIDQHCGRQRGLRREESGPWAPPIGGARKSADAAARRAALWRHGRHQHDAVHRRDAGAADHLHGRRAAAGYRRADRPAADQGGRAQYR